MIKAWLKWLFGVFLLLLLVVWLVTRPAWFTTGMSTQTTASQQADPHQLRQAVVHLVEGFGPRSYRHPFNLDRISGFIASQLEAAGATVEFQAFDVPEGRFRNVIASFGPDSESLLVVGAHYDTHEDLPGADDNASGVAGLLELGRLLGRSSLSRRVVLVGFTLEEPPFFETDRMGSAVYADSLKEADVDVALMISLEMIGYFSDEPGSQTYPLPLMNRLYPDAGNFIAVVDRGFSSHASKLRETLRRETSLPAYSINAPATMDGVHFSDHRNFWFHDYPAVMVTDTAYLRNFAYHTPEDTPDRLDYTRMAQVVQGVYAHLMALQY